MRKIIFFLFFLPIFCCAQNANVFIKILDAKGQQINGESVTKGFEKWIQATSTGSAGKNNTTFNFTMPVGGVICDVRVKVSFSPRCACAISYQFRTKHPGRHKVGQAAAGWGEAEGLRLAKYEMV